MDILKLVYDFFRETHIYFYYVTLAFGISIIVFSLDDILLDLYYWIRLLFRKNNKAQKLDPKLLDIKEKRIAIMIPAWKESGIIGKMVESLLLNLNYENYKIFIGVYPNDNETSDEVKEIHHRQVQIVVNSKNGPTTKGDMLNTVYEQISKQNFDIVVMHDSEDWVNKNELKVFNYFIPEYDLVQIPIFPFEVPWYRVVHWTYADEFAESHTKDLISRADYSGLVPSAGTSTAFNKYALDEKFKKYGKIFFEHSLTEDYDTSIELALQGKKSIFLYRPFGIDLSTRAYFPDTIQASIRQKTRWNIGICFQGWHRFGWRGSPKFGFWKNLALKSFFFRDRKAILGNAIIILSYFSFFYALAYELVENSVLRYGMLPVIVEPYSAVWYIVIVCTVLMLLRMLNRFIAVTRIYGVYPGLLSIFRLPILNFINFFATTRAFMKYTNYLKNKVEISWDKTDHKFKGE